MPARAPIRGDDREAVAVDDVDQRAGAALAALAPDVVEQQDPGTEGAPAEAASGGAVKVDVRGGERVPEGPIGGEEPADRVRVHAHRLSGRAFLYRTGEDEYTNLGFFSLRPQRWLSAAPRGCS